MSAKSRESVKIICQNKKARFEYEISEVYEAGMVLTGTEVKSLRLGKGNLTEAYARIDGSEVYLLNSHISPYPWSYFNNHDPLRKRKLLLHKKEIKKLFGKLKEKGYSLIPLKLYLKKSLIKVELALAKGKKLYDKRQSLKEADAKREISRAFKKNLQ